MSQATPPDDPLLRHVPLPHVVTVPVLGVPIRFRSNSTTVLAAVHQSFGRWVPAAEPGAPQGEVRIILHPGTEARPVRSPVSVRMPDADRLIWHTAGSLGLLDLARGEAVGYVTASLLEDVEHFRHTMLEGMTLVLVCTRDRLPVHAAMIARPALALLLAGPTGRGKSTVAYAASRDGWRVLADDGVYVQTSPSLRIWGRPAQLLLPDDSVAWFPELAGREPTRQAGGKLKVAVDTGVDAQPDPVADPVVVILERGATASLAPIPPDAVLAGLARDMDAGLEPYGDAPGRVAPLLAARGGWRLTLSNDPGDAVRLLEELARDGGIAG